MSRNCHFCIAKDDEIARLHKLIEKLAVAPMTMIPSSQAVASPGSTTSAIQSLQERAASDEPEPLGAIPMMRMVDAFNLVHGDGAWADLTGLNKSREGSDADAK